VSKASDQTKSAKELGSEFVDRRQGRSRVDRRKTRNPVFEARARRVGMTLDRRQSRSGVTALFGGRSSAQSSPKSNPDASADVAAPDPDVAGAADVADVDVDVREASDKGLGSALLEHCVSWLRPLRESWTSTAANGSTEPTEKQASNSRAAAG